MWSWAFAIIIIHYNNLPSWNLIEWFLSSTQESEQPQRVSEFMRTFSICVTQTRSQKRNQPTCHIISSFNGNCAYLRDKKRCKAQITVCEILCGKTREWGLAKQADFLPLRQGDCWENLQAENVFCSGPPRKTAVKFSVKSKSPPWLTQYANAHRDLMTLPQYQVKYSPQDKYTTCLNWNLT